MTDKDKTSWGRAVPSSGQVELSLSELQSLILFHSKNIIWFIQMDCNQPNTFVGPSEVRAPAVGVAHAGGERSVHY